MSDKTHLVWSSFFHVSRGSDQLVCAIDARFTDITFLMGSPHGLCSPTGAGIRPLGTLDLLSESESGAGNDLCRDDRAVFTRLGEFLGGLGG